MEKCVYCGRDLPELPYKVKVHTRSFDVCCKECSEQAAHYVKQDKRFKTALYLLVLAGGMGFMFSAFFGGESPLRMIGAYIGQLAAGLAFVALPYPGHFIRVVPRDEYSRGNQIDAHHRPRAERFSGFIAGFDHQKLTDKQ